MLLNSKNSKSWKLTIPLALIALFLTTVIFIVDINTPLGIAIGALYALVIFYSWLLPGIPTTIVIALICSFLTIYSMGFDTGETLENNHNVGINRIISIIVIWITTCLVAAAKRGVYEVNNINKNLENRIKIKTQKLRNSLNDLALLNQAINELTDYSVILTDENCIIKKCNQGATHITGYSENELIGKNIKVIFPNDNFSKNTSKKIFDIANKTGHSESEGWQIRENGTRFWSNTIINTIHNSDNELIGYSKITKDLTQLKEAQEKSNTYLKKLKNKNKDLEQFTYIASHDLQEPLRTILNFSGIITKKYPKQLDDNSIKYFGFINSSIIRMQALISGLLDYGRLGTKKELTLTNLNELIEQVNQDLSSKISETRTNIYVENLPTLNIVATDIRLLFQNLISNAIKFQKEGTTPEIHISSKRIDNQWQISIQDNGIGIAEEHLIKIFQIFQRLHAKETYEGTGIGLSHCKKIVEQHNGETWVESEVGKGSTFYFTLDSNLTIDDI